MPTKVIAGAPGQAATAVELAGAELTEYNDRQAAWTAGADDRKAAEEREWRDAELAEFDKRAMRHLSEVRLGQTPTEDIAVLDAWADSLRKLPEQAGFPNSHARPARP